MYGVTDGNPTPFLQRTYYKALIGHIEVDPTFKWLWKSCCQTKHMAFSWLQIKDRLSSRNMLRRRNMTLDSCNCGLCSLAVEEVSLFKEQLQSEIFMVATILMSWEIWTVRSKTIFEQLQMSSQDYRMFFNKETLMVSHGVKPCLSSLFDRWI